MHRRDQQRERHYDRAGRADVRGQVHGAKLRYTTAARASTS